MRLSREEREAIVRAVTSVDEKADVYVFGSRTDDAARGGDIDILVLSDTVTFDDKLTIKRRLFEDMEEQRVDIVVVRDWEDPFVRMIRKNAVRIS